jgi:sugar phosphate isomerase/epimerase
VIQATKSLDPAAYILHAYGALASEFSRMALPESGRALILGLFQNNARESIKTILAETGIPSRKIAIETIEFPLEMMLALANELDTSICFDAGHVLAGFCGRVDFWDTLEKCLPRMSHVHLHDCPSYTRTGELAYGKDHQPLGKGDLDVARFLNRLKEANYTGTIVFELTVAEALTSIQVVKEWKS